MTCGSVGSFVIVIRFVIDIVKAKSDLVQDEMDWTCTRWNEKYKFLFRKLGE